VRVDAYMSGGHKPTPVKARVHEPLCAKHAEARDERGEIAIGEAVMLTG
jgi:hypothetical protein